VTGYCFESLAEALPFAETIPGPTTDRLAAICRRFNVAVIVGLLERDGERLFNACALIGPEGVLGSYRKIHLPFLGVDRFVTPGDRDFGVATVGGMRIGMNICYDCAFPEAARVMALEGADLIVLPTNWPPGAECTADYVINTRALENKVYYMAVNRVGTERGFKFIGKSKICDTNGNILAVAEHTRETTLYAELDVAEARKKRIVRVPDKHIIDRFADRRPEKYARIASK
jgi:predicted amidohydrolase